MVPVFGVLIGLHVLAAFTQHTYWSAIPLSAAFVAAVVLTYRNIAWGLAFALLEIFIGGHGHLFSLAEFGVPLSVRIVIFLGVMLGFSGRVIVKREFPKFVMARDAALAIILAAIALGGLVGVFSNPLSAVFDDANSYLLLLYALPFAAVTWRTEERALMIKTLFVSALWVSVTTLALSFAFTHLNPEGIWKLYVFVRDARLFEVTLLSGPAELVATLFDKPWYFRVFAQGQLAVCLAGLFVGSAIVFAPKLDLKRDWPVFLAQAAFLGVILASFSRSFYVGLIAAAAVFVILAFKGGVSIKQFVQRSLVHVPLVVLGVLLVWLTIVIPPRPDLRSSPFYKGESDDTRELAVSSRWNLLPPMMDEIWSSPVIGSGFGEEVTFISDDPRVRAINPNGEWTTYRFEWGFQDIWLKMGVLGLAGFSAYLLTIGVASWQQIKKTVATSWLMAASAATVTFLYVTHVFSPYLNHPLGLATMLFVLVFYSWELGKRQEVGEAFEVPDVKGVLGELVPKVGVVTRVGEGE